MKKRLMALAGGAAVLVAAAVPLGSAHGQTTRCDRLQSQVNATESQILATEENPNLTPRQRQLLLTAYFARLSQLEAAGNAAGCEIFDGQGP
jgi:predicted outer membrane protein